MSDEFPKTDLLPRVYQFEKPDHLDWLISGVPRWLQPWTYIPRRWTGYPFAMPPYAISGTVPEKWRRIQEGYPLAHFAWVGPGVVFGPDPVPAVGDWTLQGVELFGRIVIPCYFAISKMVFGRRLHFNGSPLWPLVPGLLIALPGFWKLAALALLIGCKPDVTWGDWFWWFEFSLTWTKPSA